MTNQVANFQKTVFRGEQDEEKYEREVFKKSRLRLQKIARWISEEENQKTILDLGCSNGIISKKFAKNNEVYGLEIAENFVKMARKNGLKVQLANLEEKFPFPDKKFDLLLANEIIEHIYDTDFFLSECNRVLKDGGKMIISFPNIRNPFSFLMLVFNRPPPYSARYRSPHVRDFTYPLMKKALVNNGFNIIKKTGTNLYLPFLWFLANSPPSSALAKLFPTWSKEIVIKAKKIKTVKYNPDGIVNTWRLL